MEKDADDARDRVRRYYEVTTEASYLPNWSGSSLGFHFGLADDASGSMADALLENNRVVADALGIRPGADVLDAGCGVGGTSIWLAVHRGARPVGVTLDPNQVELARRFALERGAPAARFFARDYASTGFDPGSFDAVFHLESLCHAPDPRASLRHAFELLRSGGRYACMDLFRARAQAQDQDQDQESEITSRVARGWVLPCWKTAPEIASLLGEAGFTDVTSLELTGRVRVSAEQVLAMANNARLVHRLERALGPGGDAGAAAILDGHVDGAIAAAEGLLGGEVTYHLLTAARP